MFVSALFLALLPCFAFYSFYHNYTARIQLKFCFGAFQDPAIIFPSKRKKCQKYTLRHVFSFHGPYISPISNWHNQRIQFYREHGKSHSIAGVRSSTSPAQGRLTSTAKTLLLKAGRPPRSHISPELCSPTGCQLCRPNSLNGQPNYVVCNRGFGFVLLGINPLYRP